MWDMIDGKACIPASVRACRRERLSLWPVGMVMSPPKISPFHSRMFPDDVSMRGGIVDGWDPRSCRRDAEKVRVGGGDRA